MIGQSAACSFRIALASLAKGCQSSEVCVQLTRILLRQLLVDWPALQTSAYQMYLRASRCSCEFQSSSDVPKALLAEDIAAVAVMLLLVAKAGRRIAVAEGLSI